MPREDFLRDIEAPIITAQSAAELSEFPCTSSDGHPYPSGTFGVIDPLGDGAAIQLFRLARNSTAAIDGVNVLDANNIGRWISLVIGGGAAGAFSVESFVQPAVGDDVDVVTNTSSLVQGQVVWNPNGGFYSVVANLGSGSYTWRNIGGYQAANTNVTVEATLFAYASRSGQNATPTVVTSAYVQPAVGQSVTINTSGEEPLYNGQVIYVSRAGVPKSGGYYRVLDVGQNAIIVTNLGSVENAAPAANIAEGSVIVSYDQAPAFIQGFGVNVQSFGAVGNGLVDDTAAWQACIDAISTDGLFSGGTIFVPGGRYLITPGVLTIGGANNPVSGLIIQGTSMGIATGAKCSLICAGAPVAAPMLLIRNAHSGSIRDINFDAANVADYCVQGRHAVGDLSTTERWVFDRVRFESARIHNVLLGDIVPSQDDCSVWSFNSCLFGHSWVNALTDSHVRINAWNSFGTTFNGCQWYGTNEGGTYYPLHGVTAVGGNYKVNGGSTNALGESDFCFVGDPACQPSGATISGVESQSYKFLAADIPAGTTVTPQWSVTVVGGYHTDSSGAGSTESISWNVPSGFAPLVLNGFRPQLNVNVGTGSKVFAFGAMFTGVGSDFTGDTSNISGNWYVGSQFVTSYSGIHRRNSGSYDQTYGLGAFQTYASLCPQGVALANGDTWDFAGPPSMGLVLVVWDGNPLFFGAAGLFLIHAPAVPGTGVSALVSDPSGTFSVVDGTAGRFNLFWNAGTGRWRLQNSLGGGARVHIAYVGVLPT